MIREAVQLKKESFSDLISQRTPEAVVRYRLSLRMAAVTVAEAKQQLW